MATVKENSYTYRILKRQIKKDIENPEIDWEEQYPYRLDLINTFDGISITSLEAQELRLLIEPYKPVEPTEPLEI